MLKQGKMPAQMIFTSDACWGRENLFSPIECHWVYQPVLGKPLVQDSVFFFLLFWYIFVLSSVVIVLIFILREREKMKLGEQGGGEGFGGIGEEERIWSKYIALKIFN